MAHSTFVTLHIVLAPSLHYTFHQLAPSERIDKRKLLTPDYPLPQPVCGGGSGWGVWGEVVLRKESVLSLNPLGQWRGKKSIIMLIYQTSSVAASREAESIAHPYT